MVVFVDLENDGLDQDHFVENPHALFHPFPGSKNPAVGYAYSTSAAEHTDRALESPESRAMADQPALNQSSFAAALSCYPYACECRGSIVLLTQHQDRQGDCPCGGLEYHARTLPDMSSISRESGPVPPTAVQYDSALRKRTHGDDIGRRSPGEGGGRFGRSQTRQVCSGYGGRVSKVLEGRLSGVLSTPLVPMALRLSSTSLWI